MVRIGATGLPAVLYPNSSAPLISQSFTGTLFGSCPRMSKPASTGAANDVPEQTFCRRTFVFWLENHRDNTLVPGSAYDAPNAPGRHSLSHQLLVTEQLVPSTNTLSDADTL